MRRRDIRRSRWFEDVADYFGVEPALLEAAAPDRRFDHGEEPPTVSQARRELERRFMQPESIALLERIRTERPDAISDLERSGSWRDYVFVCINAERRAFERMAWYDGVIEAVVRPLLAARGRLTLVDYGCGSSLLTRMVSQDFGERVVTVSVDVGHHAVEFSLSRNRLYNPGARGLLLDDVRSVLALRGVDLMLAYGVFEHLPDAGRQIQGLVDALGPGGILIENYSGHSSEPPHKSDTFSAYQGRDTNLDRLRRQLSLVHGWLPEVHEGVYDRDRGERYWVKAPADPSVVAEVRRRLRAHDSPWRRARRGVARRLRRWRLTRDPGACRT
jgi:SAM-dependent methyltransferase